MERRHPGTPPDATIETRERVDAYWQTAIVPLVEQWLGEFRRDVPQARVIVYEGAGRYVYLDRGGDVLAEMPRLYDSLR